MSKYKYWNECWLCLKSLSLCPFETSWLFLLHSLPFLTHISGGTYLCAYTWDTSWHKTGKRDMHVQQLSWVSVLWSPTHHCIKQLITSLITPLWDYLQTGCPGTCSFIHAQRRKCIIFTQVAGAATPQFPNTLLNHNPEQDKFKESLSTCSH